MPAFSSKFGPEHLPALPIEFKGSAANCRANCRNPIEFLVAFFQLNDLERIAKDSWVRLTDETIEFNSPDKYCILDWNDISRVETGVQQKRSASDKAAAKQFTVSSSNQSFTVDARYFKNEDLLLMLRWTRQKAPDSAQIFGPPLTQYL